MKAPVILQLWSQKYFKYFECYLIQNKEKCYSLLLPYIFIARQQAVNASL